jgi:hypothetical protein
MPRWFVTGAGGARDRVRAVLEGEVFLSAEALDIRDAGRCAAVRLRPTSSCTAAYTTWRREADKPAGSVNVGTRNVVQRRGTHRLVTSHRLRVRRRRPPYVESDAQPARVYRRTKLAARHLAGRTAS